MPFCTKCGANIEPSVRFCNRCGTPANVAPSTQGTVPSPPTPPPVKYQTPPPPWQNALMLEQSERVVSSWRGDNETQDTVIERDAHGRRHRTVVKTKKGGVMVLTSQRLVWLEERGVFGKSYHPQMNMPLESLKGLSMGGAILKYVSVTDAEGELVFHLHGVTNDPALNFL